MRDFFKLLMLLVVAPVLLGERTRNINPTAPNDAFLYVSGDFTDSDKDGMTDVAENRFGYDANDASSFPKETYFLEENSTMIEVSHEEQVLLSSNNRFYYKFIDFHKFGNNDPQKHQQVRDFLAKVMPIMYDRLGVPVENIICKIQCVGSSGIWWSTESGRKLLIGNSLKHRVLVHEIIHAWKGGYLLNPNFYGNNASYMGFEEGITDAMSYDIMREYVRAYPTEEFSQNFVYSGWWQYTTSVANDDYDLIKFLPQTTAGIAFTNNSSITYQRYGIAGNTFLHWITKNPDAYKNLFKSLIVNRSNNYNYFFTRYNLIDSINYQESHVSGQSLRKVLDAIPVFSTQRLENRIYPIVFPDFDTKTGKGKYRYGITYSHNGWTSASLYKSEVENNEHPSYLKYTNYTNPRTNENESDRCVVDFRNQPLNITTHDVHGNIVSKHLFNTSNETDEHGNAINGVIYAETNNSIDASNFPFGLYKQSLDWVEFSKHTEYAKQEVYLFGAKNTKPYSRLERVILIGLDCAVDGDMSIEINQKHYIRPIVNGCVEIRSFDIPLDYTGTIKIDVNANGISRRYERELLDQVPDGIHLSKFVITDIDFDGTEDQYQDIVGEPYKFQVDEIPFETEFSDDELIVTWNNRTDRVWTLYYDNNNTSHYTTKGIPGEFTKIPLNKIDFTHEDTIFLKFFTQETQGVERIEFPWISINKPKIKTNSLELIQSPPVAYKWKFNNLVSHSHSKETPLVLCACYRENDLEETQESEKKIFQIENLDFASDLGQKVTPISVDIRTQTKSTKNMHSKNIELSKIVDTIDDSTLNINDLLTPISNDDLSTFIPVSTSSLDLNKMDKNTISATNSNRTSILSRDTDSDAKIEFRKRLNLNFDFIPVLDVNTNVPDRDEPEEIVLIDENQTIEQNSSITQEPKIIDSQNDSDEDIKVDFNTTKEITILTENNETKNFVEIIQIVETSQKESDINESMADNNNRVADVEYKQPVVEELYEEEVINEWDFNATNLGNNWFMVDWFGAYFKTKDTDWVYHVNLGWMYLSSTSFDSVWIFSESMGGWIWTDSEKFPYVYNDYTGAWLCIDLESKIYYDFLLDEWKKIDDTYSE